MDLVGIIFVRCVFAGRERTDHGGPVVMLLLSLARFGTLKADPPMEVRCGGVASRTRCGVASNMGFVTNYRFLKLATYLRTSKKHY